MTKKLPERHDVNFSHEIKSQLHSFGARLRELRLQKNWTLEELACRSGLSRAFLSRLESGDRQASIAAALTLSRIFDVSLASLFESRLAVEPCVIVRYGEGSEHSVNGLKYTPLSRAGRFFNLQPILVKVPLTRPGDEHYRHDGEEWIYLLSGSLTLSLAGKTYDLEPGDAAHFDSRLPHRLIARGSKDADVLLVASPLSNSSPMLPVWQSHSSQSHTFPGLNLISFSADRVNANRLDENVTGQTTVKISRINKE
jgi:transcriptional regulator with XRE-family HTH domain